LQVFSAGVQEEMDVSVDEAGEERGVAEVDDARALRVLDGCADSKDALTLDENLSGLEQGSVVDLQKASGVEHDGGGWRLLGVEKAGKREGQGAGEQTYGTRAEREKSHGSRISRAGPLLSRGDAA
jgi:hypothetical protein